MRRNTGFVVLIFLSLLVCWGPLGTLTRSALQHEQYTHILSFFCFITLWIAFVISFYGMRAFKTLGFPLLFLFLMVPVPDVLLGKLTLLLQQGSTEATYGLFRLADIPVVRNEFQRETFIA